ncbi:MAG: ATP-binding protein [Cyclobacteriaceae bacterium]
MDSQKKKLLEETYERIINVGLCIVPYEDLSDLAGPELMLFGTTKDEKIFSFSELDAMFKSQYEQMDGFVPSLDRKRLFTRISDDENNAFITEELTLTITSPEEVNTIFIRASCVMEYIDNRWKLTHWHASTPVDTENDHWHMEEWKRENEKLQKLVNQQTADLKSKNRELEIEAALERVRSRSMAMHKTEELADAIGLLQRELAQLEFALDNCIFWIIDKESKEATLWVAPVNNTNLPEPYHVPFTNLPYFREVFQAWEHRNPKWTYVLESEDKKRVDEYLFNQTGFKNFPADIKKIFLQVKKTYVSISFYNYGGLHVSTEAPISESQREILSRFSKVFDQTYTRFLDLQKAEEQAREAKIEAALERVRARSMGMQKSEELIKVVRQIGQELKEMGIDVHNSQIWTDFSTDPADGLNVWVDVQGQSYLEKFHIPFVEQPITSKFYDALEKGLDYLSDKYSKEVKDQFFKFLFKESDLRRVPQERKDFLLSGTGWVRFTVILKESCLQFDRVNLDEFTDEEKDIFKRIGKVFGQAYTRFLDLQKAEAQAREAQIEAALEKVRAQSIGMQYSNELQKVIECVYERLVEIGIEIHACTIITPSEHPEELQFWFASSAGQYTKPFHMPNNSMLIAREVFNGFKNKREIFSKTYSFKEKNKFFNYIFKQTDFKNIPENRKQLVLKSEAYSTCCTFMGYSGIQLNRYSDKPFSKQENEILVRFGKVFEQTYTRFLDLQKAEAQAAEAIKQASLDRVRGEIASMRSTDDLQNITPLIWSELETLNVSFIRCGVFIIHKDEQQVEVYLSKPDGTSLAVMHLPFDANELVTQTVEAWEKKEVYTQHWSREEFLDWSWSMMEQKQVSDIKTYQGAEEAPESLHLHFIPFNQGMLYVGSNGPLDNEEISLSESLAKAFSIAYARYEDFVKLEKAKAGIEDALSELKATQSQLVQQEKLASLGQLTAGIAHEIKNPLNFVNNFSEVSLELVEEVREEVNEKLSADSYQLTAILDDIEANLRKIHEHGSRADGIVKSMLQHSRGGDGKLEPTQLNPLIKEYVNLAFHGMRAGKEPINVDIELQLDEKVGEVPMIAEDFSRVILNVCNNAFDAMGEKLSAVSEQPSVYQPKLTVRTLQKDKTVKIEIEDNGLGIPDDIKDKILQPFFTTKKGTAGTGLGLSITNDIIKAHGGGLEIKTKEENGSVFVISLPAV